MVAGGTCCEAATLPACGLVTGASFPALVIESIKVRNDQPTWLSPDLGAPLTTCGVPISTPDVLPMGMGGYGNVGLFSWGSPAPAAVFGDVWLISLLRSIPRSSFWEPCYRCNRAGSEARSPGACKRCTEGMPGLEAALAWVGPPGGRLAGVNPVSAAKTASLATARLPATVCTILIANFCSQLALASDSNPMNFDPYCSRSPRISREGTNFGMLA